MIETESTPGEGEETPAPEPSEPTPSEGGDGGEAGASE